MDKGSESDVLDVVIVGAGLSGIGLACHLERDCPDQRYVILEGRTTVGGTWDLFRYPGIRSDSDMTTMSYSFKPWNGEQDIASGNAILRYLQEAATEYGIEQKIQFQHRVQSASWSSANAMWSVTVRDERNGSEKRFCCRLLLMCAGYYRYSAGHTPEFPHRESFGGTIVHPQQWPDSLDYRDQRVVVIGSGATAVTLVPALARKAKHVVMLQRSPTYLLSRPAISPIGKWLRALLPKKLAYRIYRWWNIKVAGWFYQRTRSRPAGVKRYLVGQIRDRLGPDFDVDTHFLPKYNPWDQRLCVVPDGDLFDALQSGNATIVTDHIDRFTQEGILLKSGETLCADLIVTATGLKMKTNGGVEVTVDGERIDFSQTVTYKGMMNSDVPNFVATFGYINASWTLRSDLIAKFVCRVIKHMRKCNATRCTPRLRPEDAEMRRRKFIEDFSSGYIRRDIDRLPQQGDRAPWLNSQSYADELQSIGHAPLEDGCLIFDDPR